MKKEIVFKWAVTFLTVVSIASLLCCYGNVYQLKGRIVTKNNDQDGMKITQKKEIVPKVHECEIGPADKCRASDMICQYNENGERKCLPPNCLP